MPRVPCCTAIGPAVSILPFHAQWIPVQAKVAVFTSHVVPSKGGETVWADMRAAYEALYDETLERIADLLTPHEPD